MKLKQITSINFFYNNCTRGRFCSIIMAKWTQLFRKIVNPSRKVKGYALGGATTVIFGATLLQNKKDKTQQSDVIVGTAGLIRFARSIRIGLTISLDYYFSMLGLTEDTPNYDVMMSRIHQRCADRIKDGCLQNGGTYIKVGQGIVSLSNVLPKEYIETLKILQDKCLLREKNELYELFEEDFGAKPEDLFKEFDPHPIAAASIAQVFQATTKDNQHVAVKVQYKDLQNRLDSDIATVRILLNISSWLHPKVDLSWLTEEVYDALKQELDFMNEGRNAERCAKDLAHLKYIHVPHVLWEYTNKRVLVTEFVDGIKISDVEGLTNGGYSLADIDYKMFEAFGHQIFHTGFVHADPHPGNVLVRKRDGKAELVILDHGLYQEVSKDERIALSHFWKAIVLNDHVNMKRYSDMLGVEDYERYAEMLTQAPLKSRGFKLQIKFSDEDVKHMQKMAAAHFDQITKCLRQMPRNLLFVLRNLNTIRAISFDHGCPVDRYAILARIAAKTAFENEATVSKKLASSSSKILFEVALLFKRIVTFWRLLVIRAFQKLGVLPDIDLLTDSTKMSIV